MQNKTWSLFTDGGSRGNPGLAAYGYHLIGPSGKSTTGNGKLGTQTNNYAEYQGIIHGLEAALISGVEALKVFSDSELVVKQINGEYQVKHAGLKPLFLNVRELAAKFSGGIRFQHIGREQNKEADRLVNEALNGRIR